MKSVWLVLGATSKIAHEVIRIAAAQHDSLVLVARNEERLDAVAGDAEARGAAAVVPLTCDLADTAAHDELLRRIEDLNLKFDYVLVAYGSLGDQTQAEQSVDYTLRELNTNFNSAASLMVRSCGLLERNGGGVLAVITSVAGDRARRSNYVYGTAKGALTLFAQGLRAKLHANGVRVLTIKPGPVDTPMTANMKRGLLTSSPQTVAKAIFHEITSGSADVMYVPSYWRAIMLVVRSIPEGIVKKLKI